MSNRDAFIEYDRTRDFSKKAFAALCYAPFTSLFFDNRGNVRVCCHNWSHPVGNILENGIDEIWQSVKANGLRDSLANYEFGPGCEHCKWRTAEGCFENTTMRRFDQFEVPSERPEWPQQMELSISTVCNLECVMCRGIFSSAIRSHREKLPPLPRLYSDGILESFRKYLPHLKRMKFLGGEPFLIQEHYRLWDMMIEDSLVLPCHVTTNGTQYNSRVEHVLDKLPISFAVSVDAASKWTYESIRVNAKYDVVMKNVQRFREYARSKGTSFSLTFCVMRRNWHEFGEFCLLGDALECPVGINTVTQPPEFGIYTLPIADLRKVLAVMERQAPRLSSELGRNRSVWFGELEHIRLKCAAEPVLPDNDSVRAKIVNASS